MFLARIILAVRSIEFCQAIFDEGDVREGLGDGCSHEGMIPLRLIIFPSAFCPERASWFVAGNS
jgi:hypothetical protein